jgi:hypothetical protein
MEAHKHYGYVNNGKLVLSSPELFKEAVRGFDGKDITLTIDKATKRTSKQNRYYHGGVIPIIQYGMQEVGVKMSHEQVHELLKFKFLIEDVVTEDGEILMQTIGSTTKLNTIKFNEYIESIREWAWEYLSIEVPEPNTQTTLI